MPDPAPPPPPPPSLQIPEFVGNIGDLRLLRESLHLRIPGAFPDDDTHQLVQASPTGEPWIFTTIAWSALSGLYLWVSGVPVAAEQGGANTPLNSPNPSPIQPSEGGYVAFDASHKPGGVQIGDAIGNLATSDLADGATNEQDFGDIGPNLLTFLQGTPRDTAATNVPPGGTYIGRTIGNLRTGQIGTNAVSKQTFGKSQVSFGTANSQSTRSPTDVGSDKESSRAGFSIINSRVSAVNFPPASRGRTLGEQLSTTAVCG